MDEENRVISESHFPEDDDKIKSEFRKYRTVFTGSALMIRAEVIHRFGIYNEFWDRIGSEDIYWYSNIIQGSKVANLNNALYFYRINSTSVSRTHKNPIAFIGHDLIMKMFFRRESGKTDFINSGERSIVMVYTDFLVEIRRLRLSAKKFSWKLFKLIILHPVVTYDFLSELKSLKNS